MEYAMLFAATLLLALDFCIQKFYQKSKGVSFRSGFGFNSLLGLFTAVVFFAINGFNLNITLFSFLVAALGNCLVLCYTLLGFRLMKQDSMSLYTLFLMTGGMAVPYIWGILFLNENVSWLRVTGLVLIFSGVVLANFSKGEIKPSVVLMCTAVFFLNGFVSVVSKVHQIETNHPVVGTTEFVILGGMFKFLFAGVLYLLSRSSAEPEGKNKLGPLLLILISAVVGGVSYMLQLNGAATLPATVLYPIITGGSIVFTTIMSKLVFKEKLSKKLIISVVLCCIGTLAFL
ncbi:MAG: EamA family transporter [Clostridiales bacterium]|nr:EamA family transporter [Clostridiales bacterium]